MLVEVALGGLFEGQQPGRLGRPLGLLGLFVLDRVDAVSEQLARGTGALTRLLEREGIRRSEPAPALAAVTLEAQQPALAAGGADLQIEPAYRVVAIPARSFLPFHFLRRQHASCPPPHR